MHFNRCFSVSSCVNQKNDESSSVNGATKDSEKNPKSEATAEANDAAESTAEKELKTISIKLKELQASYLLSLADQENLRQRNIREVANPKDFAIQKFAKDLLDSIDILGVALESVPETFRTKESCNQHEKAEITGQLVNLYTGVSMTQSELQKTLKRYGVQLDDPIDQLFDPNKHEAVFQAPVPDKKPGTIFVVQKKGFLLKNRILRPAQVGVVAAASTE
ncbi:GrpE nucleotide exchange factor [Parasitella parasitica]|nr:GrpE nucleotide exchange factor [Parasitella parasitica]